MSDQRVKNMEEFATLSGLSRPTLSKFFNDPQSVRPSTRARIEAALKQYNYTPNIYAVNQNRKLTKNVGIVVPYLTDPFFTEIVRFIEERCIEAGFSPTVLSPYGEREREIDILESLRALKPAGVLFAPIGRLSDKSAIESFCRDVPTLLFTLTSLQTPGGNATQEIWSQPADCIISVSPKGKGRARKDYAVAS